MNLLAHTVMAAAAVMGPGSGLCCPRHRKNVGSSGHGTGLWPLLLQAL